MRIKKWFGKLIIRDKESSNTDGRYILMINQDGSGRGMWYEDRTNKVYMKFKGSPTQISQFLSSKGITHIAKWE